MFLLSVVLSLLVAKVVLFPDVRKFCEYFSFLCKVNKDFLRSNLALTSL